MTRVPNVNDLLEGYVTLDVECLGRIYLNAYVPTLQVRGQVVASAGHTSASAPPARFNRIGTSGGLGLRGRQRRFVNIRSHVRYPAKVRVNGHEWAKRTGQRGLGARFLANASGPVTTRTRPQ